MGKGRGRFRAESVLSGARMRLNAPAGRDDGQAQGECELGDAVPRGWTAVTSKSKTAQGATEENVILTTKDIKNTKDKDVERLRSLIKGFWGWRHCGVWVS